ncbi:alpha/beta hydrolase [Streptomyces sp. CBMA152]|uniref:alpha/beta hydrolase n=1 Tax=Streptomyces sp. CBMA152 TaxID=1896312 RepID=UPI001660116B|nr:alpha/beta hydrolase [Streptomyces sp. CBMA152]MBD0741068.1 hydrolase [Streptomyces sp. CBMA152]
MKLAYRNRLHFRATTALVAALSLTAALPASAAADHSLDRYYRQSPAWKSCVRNAEDTPGKQLDALGARCAAVKVPPDYTHPGGRTISVAVAVIPATDRAHRIGALVVNEGGPGDPAIDYLTTRHTALKKVAARFDLVGIDPRFVGRNAPLECRWPTSTYMRAAGVDRADFLRMTAFQRGLAAKCRRNAGDLLPYASSRNAARDMDVVRGVLGRRRISYLGISYGTYLGEVYTAMFPGRTDRVVFDGVHEPRHLAPWAEYGTEQANENALRHWATWAATDNAAYGLGSTADAVLATVDRVQAAAVRKPLVVGTYKLDRHAVPLLMYGVLGEDLRQTDQDIAVMVRTLKRAAETGRAEPDPGLAELLPSLFTGQDSAYGSTQTAYLCADTPGPRDPEVFWRAVEHSRAHHPLFGPLFNDITPCAFWTRPPERPTVVDNDVPALLVNSTGDPRVLYSEAQAMHTRWPSSRLLTVRNSDRHAVYGLTYANACVNDTVNTYLASGRLPSADLTCTGG